MNDKVSINVVAYNQENLISETIESILAQTHQNIEILIADDCSTDKTPQIAEYYQKKYPDKIRFLPSLRNEGIVANATKGLKAATGDYFCIFSGDDIMLPHNLETQLTALRQNPWAVMSHGNALWFDNKTGETLQLHHKYPIKETTLNACLKVNNICGPASMVRKDSLPEAFRVNAGYSLDWIYYIETLTQGDGVYIHEPIIKYRRHNLNLSADSLKTATHAISGLEYVYNKVTQNPNIFIGFSWLYGSIAKKYFISKKYYLFIKNLWLFSKYIFKYVYFSTKSAVLRNR